MITKKQKKILKKIKFAIFISDVGFGHMVRQRCIIKEIEKQFKNFEILIINYSNIHIIEETFKEKYKYIKKFNNIKLYKTKSGFFDIKKTNQEFQSWKFKKNNILKIKNILKNYDIIISDFVPEAFDLAKKLKIKSYGVCHYTWSWFFKEINYKKNDHLKLLKDLELKADKIFFPPFTPENVLKQFSNKKIKKVNFITEKKYKKTSLKNKKPIILIMDNGTQTLNNKISITLKFLKNNNNFIFYVGVSSLKKKDIELIVNSENIIPISGLKSIYSQINKADYVIARGGFNTISECLIYRKPTLFAPEKNNPEISENLKIIKNKKLGAIISLSEWGTNFNKRLNYFLKHEKITIEKNLNKINYLSNGAQQIVKTIKKELKI